MLEMVKPKKSLPLPRHELADIFHQTEFGQNCQLRKRRCGCKGQGNYQLCSGFKGSWVPMPFPRRSRHLREWNSLFHLLDVSPRVAIPGDVIVFHTDFREERKCDLFVAELLNGLSFSHLDAYDVSVLLMVPSFPWRQLETCL